MFESLKVGGKIGIQYQDHLPPFELNGYKELNPENAERTICQMYHVNRRVGSNGIVHQWDLKSPGVTRKKH